MRIIDFFFWFSLVSIILICIIVGLGIDKERRSQIEYDKAMKEVSEEI